MSLSTISQALADTADRYPQSVLQNFLLGIIRGRSESLEDLGLNDVDWIDIWVADLGACSEQSNVGPGHIFGLGNLQDTLTRVHQSITNLLTEADKLLGLVDQLFIVVLAD